MVDFTESRTRTQVETAGYFFFLAAIALNNAAQIPVRDGSAILLLDRRRRCDSRRIDELLAQMALEEKLGQQMLDRFGRGRLSSRTSGNDPQRLARLDAQRARREADERAQRVAMTESRLKIPVVFAFDVIHGYRAVFPVPLGEAASFDPGGGGKGPQVSPPPKLLRRA